MSTNILLTLELYATKVIHKIDLICDGRATSWRDHRAAVEQTRIYSGQIQSAGAIINGHPTVLGH